LLIVGKGSLQFLFKKPESFQGLPDAIGIDHLESSIERRACSQKRFDGATHAGITPIFPQASQSKFLGRLSPSIMQDVPDFIGAG
jgi:hypothetical protein